MKKMLSSSLPLFLSCSLNREGYICGEMEGEEGEEEEEEEKEKEKEEEKEEEEEEEGNNDGALVLELESTQ